MLESLWPHQLPEELRKSALSVLAKEQAPETSAAFARARELAGLVEDPSERFSAYYGLWVGHLTR